ncbi:pentapeptide repeat-containing protein [Microbacterium lacus]|uniref:pentapeptide repeat-containing protein n=1 Tax=Microbacterium lacus TaxID=415217 RepID=UPI00384AE7AB
MTKSESVGSTQWWWAAGLSIFVVVSAVALVFVPQLLVTILVNATFQLNPTPLPLKLSDVEYVDAVTSARTAVLLAAGGVLAVITLYFTRVRDAHLEAKHEAERAKLDLDRDANRTDRYGRAIEQLGADSAAIRLGGIFALERLAVDSTRDRQTISNVLTGWVRDNTEFPPTGEDHYHANPLPPSDLLAATEVIGRISALEGVDSRIDLSWTDLGAVKLRSARLAGSLFVGARLTSADFAGADLRGASFRGGALDSADLSGANLTGADLTSADLHESNLEGSDLTRVEANVANFRGAKLSGTKFIGANIVGATFAFADLCRARLDGTNLQSVDLRGANLRGASLLGATNLTASDVNEAEWNADTLWPIGFEPNGTAQKSGRAG